MLKIIWQFDDFGVFEQILYFWCVLAQNEKYPKNYILKM